MRCVYKIISPSFRVYIGQTADLHTRIKSYKYGRCKGQIVIWASIQKYGWDAHTFEVLMECNTIDELNFWERFYISLYDSTNLDYGMNLQKGGKNGLHSEETKRKISASNMGKKMSSEARAKMSAAKKGKASPHKGKKLSEQARRNMSLSGKGRKLSDKTRQKMSQYRTGRKRPEHGELISRIQVGRKHSKETIEKIRQKHIGRQAWNKGIPHSEATKQKIREAKSKKN